MAKNIKITPANGTLDFIGNTLNSTSLTRFIVDAAGNITLVPASTANSYIAALGIDPAVLLGTANQIVATPGGANGHITFSFPNTVVFPGNAQVASAPTVANDLINKAYFDANATKRFIVRATANTNVSISSASASVDGLTLATNDHVLLTGQTDQTQNGIYIFNGVGVALTRPTDFDEWSEIIGALISVQQGSAFGGTLWMSTALVGGTVGSTAITFKRVDGGANLVPGNAGVVHTDGSTFTASKIVDADVNDVAWNKITGVPSSITTQTLQTVTANGNSTDQAINLLGTGVPTIPSSGLTMFSDTNGYFGWISTDSFFRRFSSTITADRTYILPDSDGTLVLTQGAQTIDNKTLTNLTINVSGDALGDLYYRGVSGKVANLPIGTTNALLKVAGGVPTWSTNLPWSFLTGTPTTLSGYGITDPILLRTGGTMTGNLILNTDPTLQLQAATKNYVDMLAQGLAWKNSVLVSTGGVALPSYTANGSFTVLTASANGALPAQDGVTLVNGDTILVMDETSGNTVNNGSYTVTQLGDGSNPWILTRTTDADTGSELLAATYYIRSGTTRGNRIYTMNTPGPITLGTTSIGFVQIAGTSTYTNGSGLSLVGNVFSITNAGVTNAMLANPSINLAITNTAAATPAWVASSVALGGTATLNLPIASASQAGILSAADWANFNSKAPGNNAFVQSGNGFGAVGALGTTDSFDMSFIAAGSEAFRINNVTRNVLIGTTTDNATDKLQVLGTVKVTGNADAVQLTFRKAVSHTNATPSIALQDSSGTAILTINADATNAFINTRVSSAYSGGGNTALGVQALNALITGSVNTAIGYRALLTLNGGSSNVAIGASAMQMATNATFNTVVGQVALQNATSAQNNTVIGYGALNANLTGNNNTVVGYAAGFNGTGSSNVLLGYNAGSQIGSASNRLYIANSNTLSPLIYGEFDTSIMQLNALVGIIAPTLAGSATNSALAITQTWNTSGAPTLISANVTALSFGLNSFFVKLVLNSITVFSISSSGNMVVAGTSTLNGAIFLPTSTVSGVGTIYKNGSPYISSYTGSGIQDRNIFVGYNSGNLTNTGGLNSALGYNSLKALTSGLENTAIGANALTLLTQGNNNIAVGSVALQRVTTGNNNVGIGQNALANVVINSNNTAIGHQAGLNTTGSGNVFIGYNAGQSETGSNTLYIANSNTTFPLIKGDFQNYIATINGQLNVAGMLDVSSIVVKAAINKSGASKFMLFTDFSDQEQFSINGTDTSLYFGNSAGSTNTTGFYNIGIGYNALHAVTNGTDNVAIGRRAGIVLTTGILNTLIGSQSGTSITNATANTSLGAAALQNLVNGSSNVAIGAQAMLFGNGSNNVMIGFNAGSSNSGSGNVLIGSDVASFGSSFSNRLYIDNTATTTPLLYGEFDNRLFTVNGRMTLVAPIVSGSSTLSALSLTQTWNTTGAPTLLNFQVTNTASGAAAKLLNILVGATSMINVAKNGDTFIKGGLTVDTLIAPVNAYQYVVWDQTTHAFGVVSGGGSGSGFTSAINGLSSPSSGVVQLGQAANTTTGVAQLTAHTYIPLNGFKLQLVGSASTSDYIALRSKFIDLSAASGSQILSSVNGGADITMVDFDTNSPTIVMTNSASANGSVQIQNTAGLFQIVESTQSAGFVYDALNFRFGIKTTSPTYDLHVAGALGVIRTLTGSTPNSLFTVLETWNTVSTPTTFFMNVTKTAVGAGAKLLDIQQDTVSRFQITADSGNVLLTANGIRIQNSSNAPGGISLNGSTAVSNQLIVSSGFLIGQSNTVGSSAANIFTFDPGTGITTTSGNMNYFSIIPSGAFAPTSGSGVLNVLNLQFTVNQTGSANGITRGLYINPTLTSVVDFRAIEVANGLTVIKGFASTTQKLSGTQTLNTNAMNYIFTGTTTATWSLPDVVGVPDGTMFYVKNRGTAILTIDVLGGQIYDASAVSTLDILPGDAYIFVNDGVYWNAE